MVNVPIINWNSKNNIKAKWKQYKYDADFFKGTEPWLVMIGTSNFALDTQEVYSRSLATYNATYTKDVDLYHPENSIASNKYLAKEDSLDYSLNENQGELIKYYNKYLNLKDINENNVTDFQLSIEEVENHFGTKPDSPIKGFSMMVNWYWYPEENVLRPAHSVEPNKTAMIDGTVDWDQEFYRKDFIGKLELKETSEGILWHDNDGPVRDKLVDISIGGYIINGQGEANLNKDLMLPRIDGTPLYGGTAADQSLINGCNYVMDKGYEFMHYTFVEVVESTYRKPWRGIIEVETAAKINDLMADFMEMNTHYAQLYVDNNTKPTRFILGSEFSVIDQFKDYNSGGEFEDQNGKFDFLTVNWWNDIYRAVKQIFVNNGWEDVIVGYAPNWSEYHGFYDEFGNHWRHYDTMYELHDEIMIDNYIGIIEEYSLDYEDYFNGWTSGRGWDYSVKDYEGWKNYEEDTTYKLTENEKDYAIKRFEYWRTHKHYHHTNNGNIPTVYTPGSKEIFFAEVGCSSLDAGATEPNIFYDPNSSQGNLPRDTHETVSNTTQYLYYKSLIANIENGNLNISGYNMWNIDPRGKIGLFSGYDYYVDFPRYSKGHWIKYHDTEYHELYPKAWFDEKERGQITWD